MAGLSYQERKAKGLAKRARKSLKPHTASPVVGSAVSEAELLMLASKEVGKVNRKVWAKEVLALVQSRPNEWVKLEGKYYTCIPSLYLRPLGIKCEMSETTDKATGQRGYGFLFVKWEVK